MAWLYGVSCLCLSLIVSAPPAQGTAPLTISVRARSLQPGEVVALDLTAAAGPLESLNLQAFDKKVVAFPVAGGAWRALIGIDLDVPAGDTVVQAAGRLRDGTPAEGRVVLTIEPREFPTRTLRVAPRFVTPPPSANARIARERVALGRVFASVTSAPAWEDPFIVPIPGALVSGFGVRSIFNNEPRAPHGGADFASPTGTPVAAPNAGRVVLVDDLYFTGQTVVVDHGAGLQSLFAHLSSTDVHVGDAVAKGATLGAVGATGRATGPHLHWTVRLNGARVDPLSLVYATGGEAPAP